MDNIEKLTDMVTEQLKKQIIPVIIDIADSKCTCTQYSDMPKDIPNISLPDGIVFIGNSGLGHMSSGVLDNLHLLPEIIPYPMIENICKFDTAYIKRVGEPIVYDEMEEYSKLRKISNEITSLKNAYASYIGEVVREPYFKFIDMLNYVSEPLYLSTPPLELYRIRKTRYQRQMDNKQKLYEKLKKLGRRIKRAKKRK